MAATPLPGSESLQRRQVSTDGMRPERTCEALLRCRIERSDGGAQAGQPSGAARPPASCSSQPLAPPPETLSAAKTAWHAARCGSCARIRSSQARGERAAAEQGSRGARVGFQGKHLPDDSTRPHGRRLSPCPATTTTTTNAQARTKSSFESLHLPAAAHARRVAHLYWPGSGVWPPPSLSPAAVMSRPSSRASGVSSTGSSGHRVRVAVRVRPPLQHEGQPECILCEEDGKRLKLDTEGKQGWPVRGAGPRARSFSFDSVHDRETTQEELFNRCGMPELLDATLDGYTATVFAYGQTGSGKTYTVSGAAANASARGAPASSMPGHATPTKDAGLMQRTAHYLYEGISARPDVEYTVRATYLEIYNEQVVDLIEPGAPLPVRGNVAGGFYVEDLSVVHCRGLKDLQYVIARGLENRHRRVHQLNSDSSRSHSIFSIYVDATDGSDDADDSGGGCGGGGPPTSPSRTSAQRYGRISLLDLAGSENVRTSQSQGAGLKEAGSINKSLFALGQVIKALSHSSNSGGGSLQASGGRPTGFARALSGL